MIRLNSFTMNDSGWSLTIRPNGLSRSPLAPSGSCIELGAGMIGVPSSAQGLQENPPRLAYKEVTSHDPLLMALRLREHTEYDISLGVPLSEAELKQQLQRNPIFPFSNPRLQQFVSINGEDACKYSARSALLTGRLKMGNHAGVLDLSFEEAHSGLSLLASVVSTKIDYEDEFRYLVSELADIHAELILRLDAPTELSLLLDEQERPSTQVQIFHLRRLMQDDRLPKAIHTVMAKPAYRHRSAPRIEKSAFVSRPDMIELHSNPVALDWTRGGPLAEVFSGYTPATLPTREVLTDHDIVENRFIKYRLKRLLNDLCEISTHLSLPQYAASRASVSAWVELVRSWLSRPFWQSIGECASYPNSMVLLERRGYREITCSLMAYDQGLKFHSSVGEFDPTSGDLRPVYDLYEIWCYFQLRSVLASLTGVPGNPSYERLLTNSKLTKALRRGAKGSTEFRYKHAIGTDIAIRLYYNRDFAPCGADDKWADSYSALLHPDFSIEICAGQLSHWVHFDAKYKLDRMLWKDEMDFSKVPSDQMLKDQDTYKRIDLHVMHSYRDALLGTRGSYILYPGTSTEADVFVRHGNPAYRSGFPAPGVGAFPLRPSKHGLAVQLDLIRNHIDHIINAAAIHSEYCNELGYIIPSD